MSNDSLNSSIDLPLRFAYHISIWMTVLGVVTFVTAILTPPLSGPFCVEGCFQYPYLEIMSRFPRDYIWMYMAVPLNILFVIFMSCIYFYASANKKLFALIGVLFGTLSAGILTMDYFMQIAVVQPSLVKGETHGIPILTQYNPHGIFIVLEELGYLLMSLSFFCVAPVFAKGCKQERAMSIIQKSGFFITLVALVVTTALYGIFREYIFEVIVIAINWLVLIISGILFSIQLHKVRVIGKD